MQHQWQSNTYNDAKNNKKCWTAIGAASSAPPNADINALVVPVWRAGPKT